MSAELEARIIALLERREKPEYKKVSFWASWTGVIGAACAAIAVVSNAMLEQQFGQWVKKSSPYAMEKELNDGRGIIQLNQELRDVQAWRTELTAKISTQQAALDAHSALLQSQSVSLVEILRELKTQSRKP